MISCYIIGRHSMYLGPFYMRGTWLAPIQPDEPYVEGTSRYLGYPVMPAYTFLTTKGFSQTRWFERPILITLLEHHMISSDIKDCNFTLLWSWNTPVMPVLTSERTTRSLENKGLSKESIMQDGSASNTL